MPTNNPAPKWHGRLGVLKMDTPTQALQVIANPFLNSAKFPRKTDRPKTPTFGDVAVRYGVKGLRGGTSVAIGGYVVPQAVKIHGRLARFLIGLSQGAYAVESSGMKVKLTRKADWPKSPTFNNSGLGVATDVTFDALGLSTGDVSLDGYFDATVGGIHDLLRFALDADPATATIPSPLLVVAPMGYAIGNPIDLSQIQVSDYNWDFSPEKLIGITGTVPTDDYLDWGYSLHDLVAEVGVTNFASVDETGPTGGGGILGIPSVPWGVGHLMVTAMTGGPWTIKIQHAPDNATWTDLIVFGSVTGLTAALGAVQRILAPAGTQIQRYTRGIISAGGGGSITFQLSFARRGFGSASNVLPGTLKHWLSLYGPFAPYGVPGAALGAGLGAYGGFQVEMDPAGTSPTFPKYTFSGRLSDFTINYDIDKPQDFSASVVINGAVVEGSN